MAKTKTALVVDGSNFLWKAYAAPFEFTSESGTRLDVITVFLSLLRSCVSYSQADHAVVVFDHPKARNFRVEDDDYKVNRVQDFSEALDSPFHHLDNLKKVLDLLSIKWVESDLAEGDDIIFTLANNFRGKVFIASSDTDFYQCVSKRVNILKVRGSKNIEILDEDWIRTKLGIEPIDYVRFKALTGDKTDNIGGIKGVGPKTAARVINDSNLYRDYQEYEELILKNIRLIELAEVKGLTASWDNCELIDDSLALKNAEIFNRLGL